MTTHSSSGPTPDSFSAPNAQEPDATSDVHPIDVPTLTDNCLGNSSFANSLLDEFEKTVRERTSAIEQQVAQGDLVKVLQIAHSLAGVAAILAAAPLSDIACRLQHAAENNDVALTNQLVAQLRQEANRVLEYLPVVRAAMEQRP